MEEETPNIVATIEDNEQVEEVPEEVPEKSILKSKPKKPRSTAGSLRPLSGGTPT